MVAPRALVFRPLVKGNEALGTRLQRHKNENEISDMRTPKKRCNMTSGRSRLRPRLRSPNRPVSNCAATKEQSRG